MIVYNTEGENIGSLIEYDEQGGRLIVQRGFLFTKTFSIPVDHVVRAVADGIQVRLTSLDLQSGAYTIPTVATPQPNSSLAVPPQPSLAADLLRVEEAPARSVELLDLFRVQAEELDAKDAQTTTEPPQQAGKASPERGVVFIVHGRDWGAKEATARLVEGQDLEAVILAEQPNGGRTLIEKFEAYAAAAVFAIVLLTPDDIGGLATAPNDGQARARENVIFELGYFVGQLGRDKVCLVRKGDVNILSDLHGVAFIPLDEHDAWKGRVLREMDQAGIPIDMSRLHF